MAPPWKRLAAHAGRVVDRLHGECVAVQPIIKSDYTEAAPDPNRAPKTVRGVFSLEFATSDLRGQRLKGEFAGVGRAVVGATCLKITAEDYAAVGYEIKDGDHLTMTEQDDQPVYTVSVNHPLGTGRLLVLTRGAT